MAKPGNYGTECGKRNYFSSQAFQSGLIGRNRHLPLRVVDSDETPHALPNDSSVSLWEPIPNLKSLFSRKRFDISAESSEELPTKKAFPSQKDRSSKFKARSSFPKNILLKPNLSTKDLNEHVFGTPISPNQPLRTRVDSQQIESDVRVQPMKYCKRNLEGTAAWEPPPLFQAYPQAIKYSHLPALNLSTDAILRSDSNRKTAFARGGLVKLEQTIMQGQADSQRKALSCEIQGNYSLKGRHRQQPSNATSKHEWIRKVFILVNSGHLLQYSGSGTFDRLPEKTLQLSKDSVAFASDVIPGKHWVLQVSQATNSDGVPVADSRSILSRLTNWSSDDKKIATSLLLILNSAEDLESWITVLRREILALRSTTGDLKTTECDVEDNPLPSLSSLIPPLGKPLVAKDDFNLQNMLENGHVLFRRRRTATQDPSTGHNSLTNSFVSQDGRKLESLSGSHNRSSYMSSSQRTFISSQSTSPNVSPILGTCDKFYPNLSTEDSRFKTHCVATAEYRKTMRSTLPPRLDSQDFFKSQRKSFHGESTHTLSPSTVDTDKQYAALKISILDASQASTYAVSNGLKKQHCSTSSPSTNRPHSFVETSQAPVTRLSHSNESRNVYHHLDEDAFYSVWGQAQSETLQQKNENPSSKITRSPSQIALSPDCSEVEARKSESHVQAGLNPVGFCGCNDFLSKNPAHKLSHSISCSPIDKVLASAHLNPEKDIVIIKPSRKVNTKTPTAVSKMRRISSPGENTSTTPTSTIQLNHIADQISSQLYTHVSLSQYEDSPSSYYSKAHHPNHSRSPIRSSFPQSFPIPPSSNVNVAKAMPRHINSSMKSSSSDKEFKPQNTPCDAKKGPHHCPSLPSLICGPSPLPPPKCSLPPLPPGGPTKRSRSSLNVAKDAGRSISEGLT